MAGKNEALRPLDANLNYNSLSERCIARLQDTFHVPSQKDSWKRAFESTTIDVTEGLRSPQQPQKLRSLEAIKFKDVL